MSVDAPPLSPTEYEAIAEAVMETSRGRWFLAEYARRNRHADTETLLAAMARLENVLRTESAGGIERLRSALAAMAESIADAKADIAGRGRSGARGLVPEPAESFEAMAVAGAAATAEILAAAEQIQEVAWTLREQGHASQHCDALDACATAIYAGCTLQDFAGRGARTAVDALCDLESRIAASIGVSGTADPARPATEAASAAECGGQSDADEFMAPSVSDSDSMILETAPLQRDANAPERQQGTLRSDPLARLSAMTDAEKLALFT